MYFNNWDHYSIRDGTEEFCIPKVRSKPPVSENQRPITIPTPFDTPTEEELRHADTK